MSPDQPLFTALETLTEFIRPAATAIPVFIGYTEKAVRNEETCFFEPVLIHSTTEFISYFGEGPLTKYTLVAADEQLSVSEYTSDILFNPDTVKITPQTVSYRLYSGILNYFGNAGEVCYVFSVGTFDYSIPTLNDPDIFLKALEKLCDFSGPTLVNIPDSVELTTPDAQNPAEKYASCFTVQTALVTHCANQKDRFALLDVPGGYTPAGTKEMTELMTAFRNGICPPETNGFGAAYYPWIQTDVVPEETIHPGYFSDELFAVLRKALLPEIKNNKGLQIHLQHFIPENTGKQQLKQAHEAFLQIGFYRDVVKQISTAINLVPPCAAVAGTYAYNDVNKGVWYAPANIGFNTAKGVSATITDQQQSTILNNPPDGKAICAIRTFTGKGTLIWGGRTLDGNSSNWRYIQLRRTIIFIEQSIKETLSAFSRMPNTPKNRETVRRLISSFLTELWQKGALIGNTSAEAFFVDPDESTTTAYDQENGNMNVAIGVSLQRPAEFIVISLQQPMETDR
jgi:phage tail sheath protein FI